MCGTGQGNLARNENDRHERNRNFRDKKDSAGPDKIDVLSVTDGEDSGLVPDTDNVDDEGGKEEDAYAAEEKKDEEYNKGMDNGGTAAKRTTETLMVRRIETKNKDSNTDMVDKGTLTKQTTVTSTTRRAWGGVGLGDQRMRT